jgi:hypothetical protein
MGFDFVENHTPTTGVKNPPQLMPQVCMMIVMASRAFGKAFNHIGSIREQTDIPFCVGQSRDGRLKLSSGNGLDFPSQGSISPACNRLTAIGIGSQGNPSPANPAKPGVTAMLSAGGISSNQGRSHR